MKHLIETTDLNSLPIVEYDRIILDSTTNEIAYRGGGYEYVDLGLPSGLKWAKCNVGAKTETDYGNYYMWGSTKANTPDECFWANAPFKNGPSNKFTKYCTDSSYGTVDNKTTLEFVDDAAKVIMGDNWRMPTQAEFQELLDNTTNKWFTNYNGTGVNGRKFTGSNGKSIFIPAAGNYGDGEVGLVGQCSYVWSSSLETSSPDRSSYLDFGSNYCDVDGYDRYCGMSVRGVCE